MTDITAPLSTSTASVITTSSNGIVIDYSSYFERIASSLETIAAATTITAIISNSLAAIATTNTFIAASLDIIANASTASQASLAAIATTDTFIAASLDSIAITNAAIESTNTTIATLLATIANASTSTSASLGELSASHATVALSNVVTGVTHVTNMLAGINGNGVNPVVTPDGITIPGVSKELGSSLSAYSSTTTTLTATFVASVGGTLGNMLYVNSVSDGALYPGMNITVLLPDPTTAEPNIRLYKLTNTIDHQTVINQVAGSTGTYLLQNTTLHRDTVTDPGYNGTGVYNTTTVILSTSSALISGLTTLLSKIQ
jgi:hypothetical protein